jgi:hypothetical protein
MSGRIPCTKTNEKGTFDFTVKDVPDTYVICASTSDFVIVFVGDKKTRVTCTEPSVFSAQNESRNVVLKFKAKEK